MRVHMAVHKIILAITLAAWLPSMAFAMTPTWSDGAVALENAQDWQGLLNCSSQRTRAEPGNALAWLDLGFAYGNLGRHSEAIAAYREVLRLKPDNADAAAPKGWGEQLTKVVKTSHDNIKSDLDPLESEVDDLQSRVGSCFVIVTSINTLDYILSTTPDAGTTIVVPSTANAAARTLSATNNQTLPAGVSLWVLEGAPVIIPDARTLTINGSLSAGPYQVFSCTGTGKVVFAAGAVKEAYPDWWAVNTTPGTTDMTAAVQAAITAMATNGIWGKVSLLPVVYKLTSTITASSGFTLDGVAPGITACSWLGRGGGSWLYIAHNGKGIQLTGPGGSDYSDAYFQNFGTYRDQPTPGASWAPTAHDYDFYVNSFPGTTFTNIFLYNPTKGIWAGGNSGRANFYNVRGQPLEKGIVIDSALDICRFDQIHFWPYWSANANVISYTQANLDAIQLIRCDNPMMTSVFGYATRATLRLSQNAYGRTSLIKLDNLDSDASKYGIWVDCTVIDGVSGQFANFTHMGSATPGDITGSMGIYIEGNYATFYFTNALSQFDYYNGIHVNGTGNQLYFNNLQVTYYDQGNTNVPAIDVAAGNYVTISPSPLITGGVGTGGRYAATGDIRVDEWRGYTPTVTATTGQITTLGNVLGAYKVVGNAVSVKFDISITDNGTGATSIQVTLPFATPVWHSMGIGKEIAVTGNSLTCWTMAGVTYGVVHTYNHLYPGGSGYRLVGSFEYLIAP